MKAIILVGGEGKRLQPLTCTVPKPMLPLMNIPFMAHIIRLLREHNICDIILSTSYLPEVFGSYFGDGEALEVNLTYVTEEEPLGTCGAVKNAEEFLDDTFLVFNGDILTNLNLSHLVEYHQIKEAKATLALTSVEDPTIYGLVPTDTVGRVVEFLEKPSWDEVNTDLVNAGTYVLEPEVLRSVPKGKHYSFERELFPALLQEGEKVFGFPPNAYWLDVGTPERYLSAHYDILEGSLPFSFEGEEIKPRVWVGEGTKVSSQAMLFGPLLIGKDCVIEGHTTIFSHTTIGNHCHIKSGARLERCVVLDNCFLDEGSVVRNSVLGQGLRLGKKVHVEERAVLGDNIVIGDENYLKRGVRVWPETKLEKGVIKF